MGKKKVKVNTGEFLGVNPYSFDIPIIPRPHSDLAIPVTRDEQLYCWFYWMEKIMDPKQTGFVLDVLIRLPSFEAKWGADWYKGEKLVDKTETFINENEGI
jgi:hypothetical protein